MFIKPSSIISFFLWILRFLIIRLSLFLSFSSYSILIEWKLLDLTSSSIWFYTIFDFEGLLLSAVVLFISTNVFQFASFYIEEDPNLTRFSILVVLFVLSINFLIFFPHFIILLLGWDGLGVTSFILVIYYQSPTRLGAGIITALTNRIGDVLILIGIRLCLYQNHWNILLIWRNPLDKLLILFITLAAMTKRAQIPFSRWLPAAIAAPTPVSALVHSSTLVTAGVFLLVRFYPFLKQFKLFSSFLLIISCLTIIIAGLAAIVETDLKKIIALSTLSQLGVIISAVALGLPILALFHLITHALFKALLFVCAGAIIHFNNHSQDLRKVGKLNNQIPSIIRCFLISNIALCGLPFIAGFYSKDLILEISSHNFNNILILAFLLFGTLLTARYSIRFLVLGWISPASFFPFHPIKDSNKNSIAPSTTLSIGAIIGGRIFNWIFLCPHFDPFIPFSLKISPFYIVITALILSFFLFQENFSFTLQNKFTLNFLATIWFLTPLATQSFLKFSLNIRIFMYKNLDQGWNEIIGSQGLSNITNSFSLQIINIQKTSPTFYILISIFSLFPFCLFLCFDSLNKA